MSENEQHQQWYDIELNNIRELRYTLVQKALQVIKSIEQKCDFIEQILRDIKDRQDMEQNDRQMVSKRA